MILDFSDEKGDHPRPLPAIKELKHATDVTVRKERPAWDYDVCGLYFMGCLIKTSSALDVAS